MWRILRLLRSLKFRTVFSEPNRVGSNPYLLDDMIRVSGCYELVWINERFLWWHILIVVKWTLFHASCVPGPIHCMWYTCEVVNTRNIVQNASTSSLIIGCFRSWNAISGQGFSILFFYFLLRGQTEREKLNHTKAGVGDGKCGQIQRSV